MTSVMVPRTAPLRCWTVRPTRSRSQNSSSPSSGSSSELDEYQEVPEPLGVLERVRAGQVKEQPSLVEPGGRYLHRRGRGGVFAHQKSGAGVET